MGIPSYTTATVDPSKLGSVVQVEVYRLAWSLALALVMALETVQVPVDAEGALVVGVKALPSRQIHRCARKLAADTGRLRDSLGTAEDVSLRETNSRIRCCVVQVARSPSGLEVSMLYYLKFFAQAEAWAPMVDQTTCESRGPKKCREWQNWY